MGRVAKPGTAWPYPSWIAHRGAGPLAPENTLAAFRTGAAHGWRMFECDVRLSADGIPFLLHDPTLDRTTSGSGPACAWNWAEQSRLDAGGWHSPAFAGEPLPTLGAAARLCIADGLLLDVEVKPAAGADRATGHTVAATVARLWQGCAVPPLISSFSRAALQGARRAAPALPRGLLLESRQEDWLQQALALQCAAVIFEHTLCDAQLLARARAAGLRTLVYTVDEMDIATRLQGWGADGIITDRIADFGPAARISACGDAPAAPA